MLNSNALFFTLEPLKYPTPVTLYKYNQATGATILIDEYGNNDGNISGMTFGVASGVEGNSGFYSGSDYVNSNIVMPITDFTVMTFFKPTDFAATRGIMSTSGNTGTDRQGFLIAVNTAAEVYSVIYNAAGGVSNATRPIASASAYQSVALSYAGGVGSFYFNGAFVENISSLITSHYGTLHLGSLYGSAAPTLNAFYGNKDLHHYWDSALGAADILEAHSQYIP